jgi:exodeoxyribonuclease-3
MRFISWNVNGLRACLTKGFTDYFSAQQPDFMCLQETKMQPGQAEFPHDGYTVYMNSAEKKGYSGTLILARHEPLDVKMGLGIPEHDHEGRTITLKYPAFTLVTVYTPNSQRELTRLEYRQEWEAAFREYLMKLDRENPVIVCGDMNVAHQAIDLKNPKSNEGNAGYTKEERACMDALLASGFTDTFRHLYPDRTDAYTWWSYMFHAREKNVGWRIDYFLCSDRAADRIVKAEIHDQVMGSDHCPILLAMAD